MELDLEDRRHLGYYSTSTYVFERKVSYARTYSSNNRNLCDYSAILSCYPSLSGDSICGTIQNNPTLSGRDHILDCLDDIDDSAPGNRSRAYPAPDQWHWRRSSSPRIFDSSCRQDRFRLGSRSGKPGNGQDASSARGQRKPRARVAG